MGRDLDCDCVVWSGLEERRGGKQQPSDTAIKKYKRESYMIRAQMLQQRKGG